MTLFALRAAGAAQWSSLAIRPNLRWYSETGKALVIRPFAIGPCLLATVDAWPDESRGVVGPREDLYRTWLHGQLDGPTRLMLEGLSRMPTDAQMRAKFPAIDTICRRSTLHDGHLPALPVVQLLRVGTRPTTGSRTSSLELIKKLTDAVGGALSADHVPEMKMRKLLRRKGKDG